MHMYYELFIGCNATHHLKTHSVSCSGRLCHILCFISGRCHWFTSGYIWFHLQPCISHVNALRFHTEHNPLLQSQSRVNEAVAKEQSNSSGTQSTSACTVYAWHHFHNMCKLKLLTLKMAAKCFFFFVFFHQWQLIDRKHLYLFASIWSKIDATVYIYIYKPLYNKVVKTDFARAVVLKYNRNSFLCLIDGDHTSNCAIFSSVMLRR